ncbi:MAG: HisA/HisF-related TIM barrel protein, partial [Candidatus Acidiferrum sp.]
VWETRKAVKIPILGLGGIESVEDVLEYLAVGATAVQVGTASFADPTISEALVEGLARAVSEAKVLTISSMRDKSVTGIG